MSKAEQRAYIRAMPTTYRNSAEIRRSGKFQKGYNAGTAICENCHKRTQKGITDSCNGFCQACYDSFGLENEHQDGYHDADQNGPNAECPMCPASQESTTVSKKLPAPD